VGNDLASTSRVDSPRTQPAMTSASNVCVRGHALAQQPRGERGIGAAQLGPLRVTGPLAARDERTKDRQG
jgi:hypothetical protein